MGGCSLKLLITNQRVRQTFILLAGTVFSMLFLLGANFLLARAVNPTVFGNFYFILNIYTFCQTVLNFGFFQSVGRLTALSNTDKDLKDYYGVGLLISFFLYLLLLTLEPMI